MEDTNVLKDKLEDKIRKKSEEAEGFLSDTLAKIRATMTQNSDKTYGPPSVPETPSKVINDMLTARCGHTFKGPVKYYLAVFICLIFSAISKVYGLIYKDQEKGPSHSMWMAACGIICVEHLLACIVLYYVVVALTALFHYFLYYIFTLVCLFGIGLAVAGMVFFDKDKKAKKQTPGFEPKAD